MPVFADGRLSLTTDGWLLKNDRGPHAADR
jgi:hypothetical protein